jgi:hypothetical protein
MFFLGDIRKTIYLGKSDAKTAKGVKKSSKGSSSMSS